MKLLPATFLLFVTSVAAHLRNDSFDQAVAPGNKLAGLGNGDDFARRLEHRKLGFRDHCHGGGDDEVPCVCEGADEKLDVVLLVDLSGSFGDDIEAFKTQSTAVIAALKAISDGVHVGLASFVDFVGSSPGGSPTWGSGSDYPYKKEHALTSVPSASLTATIDGLTTFFGNDGPESQLHALEQAAGDFFWRTDSTRIILIWTDNIFHHPETYVGTYSTTPALTPGYLGPTWQTTDEALDANDVTVVGLWAGSLDAAKADLQEIAYLSSTSSRRKLLATREIDCGDDVTIPVGDPIVCPAGSGDLADVIGALISGALGCVIDDSPYVCDVNPTPTLPTEPLLTYTPGDIYFKYNEWAINMGYPGIKLKFDFNHAPFGSAGLAVEFGAIVTDNADGTCGGEVIGHTPMHHLPDSDRVVDDVSPDPLGVYIWTTPDGAKLKITTPLDELVAPWYIEGVNCPEPDTDKPCGLIDICVEMQVFICGRKVTFVDVRFQVYVDLTEDCEEECGQLILQRAEIINDGGLVDPGDIECKPCYNNPEETLKFEDGDTLTLTQGNSVLTCIEMNSLGGCIRKVKWLDLMIERSEDLWRRYCVLSDDPTEDCLFLVEPGPNPNYSPVISGYDADDATVRYLLPGEEFQELDPLGTVPAHYEGSVIVGFGCCCDEPIPDGCVCDESLPSPPPPGGRHLQDGTVVAVPFTADPFSLDLEVEKDDEGCGADVFCMIVAFLQSIFNVLFGWLY